jgi:hypothetical protein
MIDHPSPSLTAGLPVIMIALLIVFFGDEAASSHGRKPGFSEDGRSREVNWIRQKSGMNNIGPQEPRWQGMDKSKEKGLQFSGTGKGKCINCEFRISDCGTIPILNSQCENKSTLTE